MKPAPPQGSAESAELVNAVRVEIEAPDDCPRYSARLIRNVKAAPSPAWMQQRLTAAGMRPIGGIVDVTNYVMLEMGQPLHAFDYDTLRGPAIIVRRARPGEKLTTLDDVDRDLQPDMLMICDVERVVAVAGVMGGAETEIGPSTKTVLLESAHFDPLSVRRTSRELGLRTEASYRFERFVDPESVVAASDRACELIALLGMGEPVQGVVDAYPGRTAAREVRLRTGRASMLLGFPVDDGQARESLSMLGFQPVSESAGEFKVRIPSWRPDVVREEDLVEEVGRVLGYENIPERLPVGSSTQGGDTAYGRFCERIRALLVGAGLQEVVSHSLLAPSDLEESPVDGDRVAIRSALSAELSGLRRSLLPGLIDALERNARRGQSPLAFFEIGKVFRLRGRVVEEIPRVAFVIAGPMTPPGWQKNREAADYHLARGIVERITTAVGIEADFFPATDARLHSGRSAEITVAGVSIGRLGELHPRRAAGLTTRDRILFGELGVEPLMDAAGAPVKFAPLSPFPGVTRDLAPRVLVDLPYSSLRDAVESTAEPLLENYALTDVFTGAPLPEGVKSLTLSFTFRSDKGTLAEEQVSEALQRIREALESACGATFVA
jgi:phenylalanyl-tRNA synthetase beta chain